MGLLDPSSSSSSPPPYEAPAYPKHRSNGVFIRKVLSVRVVLSSVLTLSILWLCLTANRYTSPRDAYLAASSHQLLQHHADAIAQCDALYKFPLRIGPQSRKSNSRWSSVNGQKQTLVLRNAALFDGESFLPSAVDITFSKGLIISVSETSAKVQVADAIEYDVHGRYVTPGLVDMHSHHLSMLWPATEMTDDTNEIHPDTGAFTPFVRIVDVLKAYDTATAMIASGGVTTSLILPGSANIIAGEGTVVKNVPYSGEHGEPVVEDILLERGIPWDERHRYMKMAYGENPKDVYGYTRLGNAWHLREHLQKAKDLKEKQDEYCAVMSQSFSWSDSAKANFVADHGKFPFQLQLESLVGVLRGRVIVQNHNYEPEDMETMLRISHEFGYRVWGFHHATEAWQIPELLKEQGDNITIATFAEFSLYKWEAYSPNLYASHILDRHGVPVAFKSDHSLGPLSAKYLASQAAVGHAFHLPEDKALQAITSIPAKAIDLDYRVGYARPGYDSDLVVWDSHPLSLGATPLQVFVDGLPQLDSLKIEDTMGMSFTTEVGHEAVSSIKPQMRYEPERIVKEQICSQAVKAGQNFIITGIRKAFVDNYPELAPSVDEASSEPLELIINGGTVSCLGTTDQCVEERNAIHATDIAPVHISLQDGHVLPGLTAMTRALGMREIDTIDSTSDGEARKQKISDPESVSYARFGIWLDGKAFGRARLGGITRAITPPIGDESGLVIGVSTEILTSSKKSLSDGGVVQDEVALHMFLGDYTKTSEATISEAIKHIRHMLVNGKGKHNETVYGKVAAGDLPLVVFCNNQYDIEQLILIKKDFPKLNLVILGGKGSVYVAKQLAEAKIPVILSEDRGAPDSFRDKDALPGPPLSRSVASYLEEAGVTYALAVVVYPFRADFRIHDLGPEAGWTAKNAGISDKKAVRLVTTDVESILGLKPSKDLVVFEGNPLKFGATVVLSFHADDETGKVEVATCFPEEDTS